MGKRKLKKNSFAGFHSYNKMEVSERSYDSMLKNEDLDEVNGTDGKESSLSKQTTTTNVLKNQSDYRDIDASPNIKTNPKKSLRTNLEDFKYWKGILATICIAITGWILTSIVDLKIQNSSFNERITSASSDLDSLQKKYDEIQNKDIQDIIKDLSFIKGRLNK